ncbi:tRNA (adenosine(37)-N6)-threonylcarbamoyltransferase complex dimerization subunit type 1 TsaB [Mycobacterium sp. KBS0706]|uniref:tRNA (adenosine(37)-N6)-threonylcarbamoyltransferase complex dimerization subunit type 1 TsaB n=1 Tax=Mycobacterium sp. KBS0706 TaxID=2578109 RepID=UPI00110FA8FB|nr:tRNA (adenosine(37)-N6)-threonylcarbamoyltransferase complex dimerization subunit type 1 TsaB [Mycobacterium sp. KBS0706]TSD86519.1 tRNA (adenosine(37)-N6)-threonylcarbamoyltransferase complex dimerization subunit type 1 TsaB [Mycobacterium sp. KBS0706]
MIVLGLDAAGAGCGVAVRRDGKVVAARTEAMAQGHAVRLMPLVLEVLAEAGVAPGDIDLFGVTTGPGSFTGLRVGLAAVGGLALGAGRKIVGIPSFDAVLADLGPVAAGSILVALDGRRTEPFARLFAASGNPLGEPLCLPAVELAALIPSGPLTVAGDGVHLLLPALAGRADVHHAGQSAIDPATVARLAEDRADQAREGPPPPLYVRPPDAVPLAERAPKP